MIKELRLKNWKSFQEAVLNIDPLTIIIGNNASGKSNTLEALLFLHRIASGNDIFHAINGDVYLPPIRGGVEWICKKPENEFTLETLIQIDENEYCHSITIQVFPSKAEVKEEKLVQNIYSTRNKKSKPINMFSTKVEDYLSPSIATYFSTASQGKGQRIDLNRTYSILSQTEKLNLKNKSINELAKIINDNMKSIFVFDPIPSQMRAYSSFSDKLNKDGSNLAGVLAALDESKKESIENALSKYLKEIPEKDITKVWAEPVGAFKTDAMLYCYEEWAENDDKHLVDARGMSDGTLRYLAIVAAILTRESGSLMVIEEVDNGLHPSRANKLLSMLKELGKEKGIDVIVTTHNPALLDAAGIKMLPFITVAHRDEKTGVSELVLLEDIKEIPKLVSMGTLGTISTQGKIESALKREDLNE